MSEKIEIGREALREIAASLSLDNSERNLLERWFAETYEGEGDDLDREDTLCTMKIFPRVLDASQKIAAEMI